MKSLVVLLLGLAVIAGGCHASGTSDGGGGGTAGSGSAGSGGSAGIGGTGGAGGGGGGTGGTGGSPSAVFPLQVATTSCAPNCNRYLVDKNGAPFFIHGEAAWSAMGELTHAEMDTYLDDVDAKGFNTVLVTSPEGVFTTHTPTWSNARDDLPMTSGNIGRFNPTYLNEAYYDYVDYFIREANARGILVILAPNYLGVGTEGWCEQVRDLNALGDMEAYGTWVGQRYSQYPNVIYVWGNEPCDTGASMRAKIDGAATNARLAHPVSLGMYHGGNEQGSEEVFPLTEPWYDIRPVYDLNSPFSLAGAAQAEYQDMPVAPVMVFEPPYENDLRSATAKDVRVAAYHGLISGAIAGHLYGAADIWDMDSRNTGAPDWDDSASLNREGRVDMGHLWDIITSIEWWKLVPSYDASILTSSRGSGDAYVSIAKTSDSHTILAYTSRGGDTPLSIDTTTLASGSGGAHDWEIINPATGAVDSSGTARANGPATVFDPAGSNADYVVLITEAGP